MMGKLELMFWILMGALFVESWGRAAYSSYRRSKEGSGEGLALEPCAGEGCG